MKPIEIGDGWKCTDDTERWAVAAVVVMFFLRCIIKSRDEAKWPNVSMWTWDICVLCAVCEWLKWCLHVFMRHENKLCKCLSRASVSIGRVRLVSVMAFGRNKQSHSFSLCLFWENAAGRVNGVDVARYVSLSCANIAITNVFPSCSPTTHRTHRSKRQRIHYKRVSNDVEWVCIERNQEKYGWIISLTTINSVRFSVNQVDFRYFGGATVVGRIVLICHSAKFLFDV